MHRGVDSFQVFKISENSKSRRSTVLDPNIFASQALRIGQFEPMLNCTLQLTRSFLSVDMHVVVIRM